MICVLLRNFLLTRRWLIIKNPSMHRKATDHLLGEDGRRHGKQFHPPNFRQSFMRLQSLQQGDYSVDQYIEFQYLLACNDAMGDNEQLVVRQLNGSLEEALSFHLLYTKAKTLQGNYDALQVQLTYWAGLGLPSPFNSSHGQILIHMYLHKCLQYTF